MAVAWACEKPYGELFVGGSGRHGRLCGARATDGRSHAMEPDLAGRRIFEHEPIRLLRKSLDGVQFHFDLG